VPCAGFGFDGIGEGRLGRPYSGDYPQPALSLSWEGAPQKGGSAMNQPQQAQAEKLPLREMGVQEVVALAIAVRRKGKESRRVNLLLKPQYIPPNSGEYETAMGKIKLKSVFLQERGRWAVTVVLPAEGFTIADHQPKINKPDTPSSPPSPAP